VRIEASLSAPISSSFETTPVTVGSAPVRSDDARDLFLFLPKTELSPTANHISPVAKAVPLISPILDSGTSLDLASKSSVFRDDGFALTRKLADFADSHIQLLLRPCLLVGLTTLNPSADRGLPQNSPKPLKFYNRKYKAKRTSKMDVGLLVERAYWVPVPCLVFAFGRWPEHTFKGC
jgi:hypothetical protein